MQEKDAALRRTSNTDQRTESSCPRRVMLMPESESGVSMLSDPRPIDEIYDGLKIICMVAIGSSTRTEWSMCLPCSLRPTAWSWSSKLGCTMALVTQRIRFLLIHVCSGSVEASWFGFTNSLCSKCYSSIGSSGQKQCRSVCFFLLASAWSTALTVISEMGMGAP